MFNKQNYPAIFESCKGGNTSDKYQFVNTAEVLSHFENLGMAIRDARQQGRGPSAKHMVRLIKTDGVTGEAPEIILLNSHNGTSTLKLMMGIFRLVCSNGLVVGDHLVEPLRLRHAGVDMKKQVADSIMQIDDRIKIVAGDVAAMKDRVMNADELINFGKESLKLAFEKGDPRITEDNAKLLVSVRRRSDDMPNNVWNVFNAVQENLIRGGIHFQGSKRSTKAVNNIDKNVKINAGLWNLASNIAKAA